MQIPLKLRLSTKLRQSTVTSEKLGNFYEKLKTLTSPNHHRP